MARSVVCILMLFLLSTAVQSGEVVTQVIESDVPMIIDGNWLYSPFVVVLTDSTITVNGYLYEGPKKKELSMPEPDREKDFLDWLVRTAVDSAQAVIDGGGNVEEAGDIMEKMFMRYADGDTLKVVAGELAFGLKYYKYKYPIGVMVPQHRSDIPKPSYREGWLEPRFKELCHDLKMGDLIIRGRGYEQGFPRIYVSSLLPELEKFKDPKYARSKLKGEWIRVKAGNYRIRLMKEAVEDIMNPKEN